MKEQKKVETKKNDNTLFSAGYQEVKPTEFPKKQKQQLDKDILKKFVPPSSSSQEYLFTKPDFLIPIVESQNLMQLRT